ncbi:hypothetical protein OEZ85_005882 [Tetradesmus obliquus]|uniref:C2H2-type domain-containing protein n=1 Tax=Tetradesmus obliquus TaxID=3088 RepID=A0ABY8UIL4_TETOB|nr:hypothetical protein OEZ85_005882 [Tetradesmus obliquus]
MSLQQFRGPGDCGSLVKAARRCNNKTATDLQRHLPKLVNHFRMCGGHAFTCVDCSRTFDRQSAQGHSTCVSEHEKYALGATKPGGYAAQGYNDGAQAAAAPAAAAAGGEQEVIGLQFLAERPPWRCSCCNVSCTSRDTLLGHASGVKHKRRARAALGLTNQQQQQPANGAADADKQADAAGAAGDAKQDTPAAAAAAASEEQGEEQQASKKQKKEKKEKKRKQEADAAADAKQEAQQQQAAETDDSKNSKKSKKEKKNKKQDEAAAEPAVATAAAAEEQPEQEASKKDKKKKDKNSKKQQQQQQPDPAVLQPLLKVARKKLKKKGSMAVSKLQALLQENANGGFSTELVEAVQQQLLGSGEVQLKDATLHWQAAN